MGVFCLGQEDQSQAADEGESELGAYTEEWLVIQTCQGMYVFMEEVQVGENSSFTCIVYKLQKVGQDS